MKHPFSQKGAAAVEFALVLPLLLVILFGIIEFSILMYNKHMITNASREGARQGIVFRADSTTGDYDPLSDGEITNVVNNYLQNNLISFAADSSTVTVSPATRASGQLLTVNVDYRYSFLALPGLRSLIASGSPAWSIDLRATTVMRME